MSPLVCGQLQGLLEDRLGLGAHVSRIAGAQGAVDGHLARAVLVISASWRASAFGVTPRSRTATRRLLAAASRAAARDYHRLRRWPAPRGRRRTRFQRATRCARARATVTRATSARRHPQDRVRPARSEAPRTTSSRPHVQRHRQSGRRGLSSVLPSRAMTTSRPNVRPTRSIARLPTLRAWASTAVDTRRALIAAPAPSRCASRPDERTSTRAAPGG